MQYLDAISKNDRTISVSSAFSKTSLNIRKFTVHILLKPGLENFESLILRCDRKVGNPFQTNIYFCFIDYTKAFDCVDHNKLWKNLKERGIPDHLTCS